MNRLVRYYDLGKVQGSRVAVSLWPEVVLGTASAPQGQVFVPLWGTILLCLTRYGAERRRAQKRVAGAAERQFQPGCDLLRLRHQFRLQSI